MVILGNAAHAVPPTTRRGVYQDFEDVYMLASLLAKLDEKITLTKSLEYWQSFRQERVDRILDLTRSMNNKRLPPAEQAKLPEGAVWKGRAEDTGQMTWRHAPDLEKLVNEWLEGHKKQIATDGCYLKGYLGHQGWLVFSVHVEHF